jgi:hypothetical protein
MEIGAGGRRGFLGRVAEANGVRCTIMSIPPVVKPYIIWSPLWILVVSTWRDKAPVVHQ